MDDMQRQMDLFEEGGIADDGMEVDPVSGNEIPPGSMASEVRDDIPAQLSEGEYVVPADVLRYYGVRFFEDLRAEAKQGMTQMEEDGRIGGDPVPAGGPQEGSLTPEEMAVLEEMGMNVGGYVPQQQPPQAVGNTAQQGMSNAYAEGGLEDGVDRANITAPAFTQQGLQDQFGLGYSLFGPGSSPADTSSNFTTAVLYSPDGMVRSLTLPTEQSEYDKLISEGWTTSQTGVTTETSVGKEEPEGRDGNIEQDTDRTPISQMDAVQLAEAKSKALSPAAKSALGVFGAITGLPVGLVGLADKMSQKSIESRAEELGIDLSTVTKGEDLNRSNFVSDDAFNRAMETVAPTGMSYDADRGSYTRSDDSLAPTTSSRPQARPGSDSTSSSSGSKGLGQSVAEALGFDNFGDMFDGGGRGASAGGSNDNDSADNDNDANPANDGLGSR